MNIVVVTDPSIPDPHYLMALTMIDFSGAQIYVFSSSPNHVTGLVDYVRIHKTRELPTNCNYIICTLDWYKSHSKAADKFVCYVADSVLGASPTDGMFVLSNDCELKSHMERVYIKNVVDNKTYEIRDSKLYHHVGRVPRERIGRYANWNILKRLAPIDGPIHIDDTPVWVYDPEPCSGMGIVKCGDDYYKYVDGSYEKLSIDTFEDELYGVIKKIKYTTVPSVTRQVPTNINFWVLVLSHNNERFVNANLKSAMKQNHPKFKVLYIDCNSTDRTLDLATRWLNDKLMIISEKDRIYQTENFVIGTLMSPSQSVIISLDGDDFFASDNVLQTIENVYLATRCKMTHGSFHEYPYRHITSWRRNRADLANLRRKKMSVSHLRTWSRELLLNVRLNDMKMHGAFPEMAGDVSILPYMVEMVPEKCVGLPVSLYVYNRTNVLSDSVVNAKKQVATADYFYERECYSPKDYDPNIAFNNPTINLISRMPFGDLKNALIMRYIGRGTDVLERFQCINARNTEMGEAFDDWVRFWSIEKTQYVINTQIRRECPEILIIAILSCHKRIDKALAKLASLQHPKCFAYIFVGENDTDALMVHESIIELSVPDNYESLPLKTGEILRWVSQHHPNSLLFKTDDDIEIDVDKLYSISQMVFSYNIEYAGNVAKFNPMRDTWHYGKCQNDVLNSTPVNINTVGVYASGGGYFLRTTLIPTIVDLYLHNYRTKGILAEDLLMGITLNSIDIVPIHLDYFSDKIVCWNEDVDHPYHSFIRTVLKFTG